MKCPRCHDPDLADPPDSGGPLSSSTCARCGGGLIPEDGLTLLLEEMKHTRDELRELSQLYGGARMPCPACRSKMSPLVLKGAPLDVCFGCGSLWVDRGELEVISGGRYTMPAPTALAASAQAKPPIPPPAQALVRVDERSLGRHVGRATLSGLGAVGVIWWAAGVMPASAGLVGAAALGLAVTLSRREAFDVLPRARRMIRWRGFFAPDAKSNEGEAFAPDACVVVRPVRAGQIFGARTLPFVTADLVDLEGRDLARLRGPMLKKTAWVEAPRYARALGVSVRFDVDAQADDALDVDERARTDLPSLARSDEVRLRLRLMPLRPGERPRRRLELVTGADVALGALLAEGAPAREPADLHALLTEHFALEDETGVQRVRFFSTYVLGQRATVLVSPDGKVFGHVGARRTVLGDTFTFRGPQGRRQATATFRTGENHVRVVDGHGRTIGSLELGEAAPRDPWTVTLTVAEDRLTGEARYGLVALAAHASLAAVVDDL